MTIDTEYYAQLQQARMDAIQKLTELNSRHISTQGQLAGIELELNRCREALVHEQHKNKDLTDIKRFEQEYSDIEVKRAVIDKARDTLNDKLQRLENEIQACLQ